jgi:HAD superfamily hydrolase (TIGR01509 family)
MVDAVVWDFDGLILDTETPIFVAWQEAYASHGVEPLTLDEWAAEIGTHRGLDVVGELERRAGYVDHAVLAHRQRRRDALLEQEAVRAGVIEWLDAADARGLRLAIASSSDAGWVLAHLARLGIRDRFGPVLCRSDEVAAKPAPDLYLAACEALGVEPARALAVEDSPNGIAAAKAAGLRCVAVPNTITGALDLSAADLVIPSLADTTLDEVLALLR